MDIQEIQISSILMDKESYTRSSLDQHVVNTYVDALKQGFSLPPITVFREEEKYWLADGYLRLEAMRQLGFSKVFAEIYKGGRRDAILFSLSANATHGLARTQADKHWVIHKLLGDPEWRHLSDQEIASCCDVSEGLVREIRNTL